MGPSRPTHQTGASTSPLGQTKANGDLDLSKVTQQDGSETGIATQIFHPLKLCSSP